ncbi:MAG: hypothetical protein H6835_06930 [Planctomycetes bacterium]|nr:hypothetical protein [Planctomycetota bacterium]
MILVLSASVSAQTLPFKLVAPLSSATTEGAASTALPFGSSVARHVMYAYDGSLVDYAAPMRIAAVALRCDGATPGTSVAGGYVFTLNVSTGRNPVNALSTTFLANHGHDLLRVHTGLLSVPAPSVGASPNAFSLRIPFDRPFDWDPRNGPLLLDFGYSASAPAFGGWDVGLNGAPIATTIGLPSLPNPSLRMRVRNAAGNAAALFAAGFAPLSVPLPGAPNCLILHGGEVGLLAATITDPAGDGSIALPLIGAPQFDGFSFRGQWWILDPSNALGIVTSDAQAYTARWF